MVDRFRRISRYPFGVRLLCFLGVLLVVWLPFALPIYQWLDDPDWINIATMGLLYSEFIVLLHVWGRIVYDQSSLLRHYGLVATKQNGLDWLFGLGLGLSLLLGTFVVQGWLGWVTWQASEMPLIRLVLEGAIVGIAVGFAEELAFRGWLLDELKRDYRPAIALWANSLFFAVAHFIRPWDAIRETWPQFLGLLLLGAILVWAKRCSRDRGNHINGKRLGLPMGLHGGLVWGYYLVNVGNWVTYSGRVPTWVTGIDGNPLAGLLGLGLLGAIAILMRALALKATPARERLSH